MHGRRDRRRTRKRSQSADCEAARIEPIVWCLGRERQGEVRDVCADAERGWKSMSPKPAGKPNSGIIARLADHRTPIGRHIEPASPDVTCLQIAIARRYGRKVAEDGLMAARVAARVTGSRRPTIKIGAPAGHDDALRGLAPVDL